MEETVRRQYIYRGKILNLRKDDVVADGRPTTREVVEHRGGCAVLCVERGSVLLVKQYRYAYGEVLTELPAGKVEEGEDPAVTAARELSEETEDTAEQIRLLYVIYPTPGYTDEKLYIYGGGGTERGRVSSRRGRGSDRFLAALRRGARDGSARRDPGRKDGDRTAFPRARNEGKGREKIIPLRLGEREIWFGRI